MEEWEMKRTILVLCALAVIVSMLIGCAKKEEPAVLGPALLTISGKLDNPNSGDKYVVDQAYLDAKSVEVKMDDPWMGDGIAYKGILVRDLLKDMGVKGATTIKVVATDGKGLDINIADAEKWDIMLAHWADGKLLDEETGGPVKIVFPADARTVYTDEQWMWWLTTADVK
jgi:hypothetical protein